jgi:hypothetical protein
MDKFNILMKEMLNNNRLIALGVSRKRLDQLNMVIRQHWVRKIFRNKYFWYAITDKNLLIEIPIDVPNDYKIVDHLLYKDLKIAKVIKKDSRIYLFVNGRINDIKALGLPYTIDEYEVKIDITDKKEIRDEVNEIILKRYEDINQDKIECHPEVFELIKKFGVKVYDFNLYLYGTIKCSFLSQEMRLTKGDKVIVIDLNITSIERIEKIIKKLIIS